MPATKTISQFSAPSFLRLPAVIARTGIARASIYYLIARGEFPAQISLGSRAVGWLASEIDEWGESRIRRTRTGGYSPADKMPKTLRDRQPTGTVAAIAAALATTTAKSTASR